MDDAIIYNLKHGDDLERCDAIEYLSSFVDNDDIAEMIIERFDDKSYLVRCEAYEAFYGYEKKCLIDTLIRRLNNDRSKCARMYICSTLISMIKIFGVNKEQTQKICDYYHNEKGLNVLIGYWCIFYQIEKKDKYIAMVLNQLTHNDYHIRCNVVNFLTEIFDSKNKEMIKSELSKQMKREGTKAVLELIEASLKE